MYEITEEYLRKRRSELITDAIRRDDYDDPNSLIERVDRKMDAIRQRGTTESWGKIRKRIYNKYDGVCQVCGDEIEYSVYECGHIVDRFLGGSDRDENLTCMCNLCNRLKPAHESAEQYYKWVNVLKAMGITPYAAFLSGGAGIVVDYPAFVKLGSK